MKKCIVIIIIVFIIILAIPSNDKEFRIRVIANSDSITDQNIKYRVVNLLIDEIKEYDNLIVDLNKNLKNIEEKIKKIIPNEEFVIDIRKERFPPKTINEEIIPGGVYNSLVVVIGKGKGKNWWTLLYPTFNKISFEDIDSSDVDIKFYFFEKIKNILK